MRRTKTMWQPCALFSTLVLAVLHSSAQVPSTISIANSTRLRMHDLGTGQGQLIASEHRFGFDSSWVELIRLNSNGSATPLTAQRFGDPLWFLFDAADGDGGIVVSGTLTNSYVPQLVRYANDGSITWTKSFSGMQFSQTRFAVLLSDGNTLTGYTNADSFGGNGLYRVSCDAATGNATEITQVTTAEDLYFRFYCGTTGLVGVMDVLGGSGFLSGSSDHKALLGAFDSNGALWLKQYELGSAEPESEEVIGIARAGGYACAMNSVGPDGLSRGHFVLVDDAGVPQTGVLLTEAAGVRLTAVHQLPSGTSLVAGSNGTTGLLLKFSPSGDLNWAKRCSNCLNAPINSFYESPNGTLFGLGPGQVHTVISNNEVCGYEPISTITATDYLPPFNDITPVNDDAPPVTVGTIALLPRPAAASASVICGEVGISEDPADALPIVSPNPFTDELLITGGILPSDRVIVRDAQGRVVHADSYGDGVQLGHLNPGLYLIEIGRLRLKAMKD